MLFCDYNRNLLYYLAVIIEKNMIKREIQKTIQKKLFKGKLVIITGARQVGKTTLIKMIADNYPDENLYLNCDEPDIRLVLTEPTSTKLKDLAGQKKLVLIDEAQRVKNIGLTLKLFVDELPEIQVIATGSSALELSNKINEPLTGRRYDFTLFPFSMKELSGEHGWIEENRLLNERIIFGMYPEITLKPSERKVLLQSLASSYLFKDVLSYQNIRRPEILEKLLIAIASQIGNEVSYNELSNTLDIDKETVAKYIDLLEKAIVIFRLPPYSKNIRTEISKKRKIYFYDTGIRNALISNFNQMELRSDAGALWENFLISERFKLYANKGKSVRSYFWRTLQQQEIDYVEEREGSLYAFEFKWSKPKKVIFPKTFLSAYPKSKTEVVNRENYFSFIGIMKS